MCVAQNCGRFVRFMGLFLLIVISHVHAEICPTTDQSGTESPRKKEETSFNKRIFGILPNFDSAEGSQPFEPLGIKQKFSIASQNSFDWSVFVVTGFSAGLAQLENQHASFGQGTRGFARRYASAFADQAIGNIVTGGVIPSLLHEDPRYFRRGSGIRKARIGYALTRTLLTRTDSGNWQFNYRQWLGTGITIAVSDAYYPGKAMLANNARNFGMQIGSDALYNVLKEFWPDIKHRWFPRRANRRDSDDVWMK